MYISVNILFLSLLTDLKTTG